MTRGLRGRLAMATAMSLVALTVSRLTMGWLAMRRLAVRWFGRGFLLDRFGTMAMTITAVRAIGVSVFVRFGAVIVFVAFVIDVRRTVAAAMFVLRI